MKVKSWLKPHPRAVIALEVRRCDDGKEGWYYYLVRDGGVIARSPRRDGKPYDTLEEALSRKREVIADVESQPQNRDWHELGEA